MVSFANFVCTFGDSGGMIDNWNIVGPAFLNDTFIRRYGANEFYFYKTKIVNFENGDGPPMLAVCGRFVRNLKLIREQTVDVQGNLVKSPAYIPSSPSAYFVLMLNTHRLIYFAETTHAPDLKSFEATVANFIKKVRARNIDNLLGDENVKYTKAKLNKKFPRPSVKVVPLSEREKIGEFIDRFSKVSVVKVKLIKPNHELDASETVNAVRATFGDMDPTQLEITARNPEGLEVSEVKKVVSEAVVTGNTDVLLRGEDREGVRLNGSNNHFALSTELDEIPDNDKGLRKTLFREYRRMVNQGKIKLGVAFNHTSEVLKSIADSL